MQNLKRILTIIAASAGVVAAQADTPADVATNSLAKPTQYPWVSEATAGLTIARGNSDIVLFNAKIGTQKKTPENEFMIGADGAYGKSDGVENAESLHGTGQYNHLFNDQFYGFINTDALKDGIQDIKYRVAVNPGAGYYLIKSKPTTLAAEVGPGIVTQKLGNQESTFADIRVAEHLDQVLTASARLWEKAELLTQANKTDNYYANFEIGVETAISKTLGLQLTLNDSYVNQSAQGRKNNDIKLIGGVSYKF